MVTVTLPNTSIKLTVEPEAKPVRITMTEDSEGKRGLKLKSGESYELPQDSADFQVRLGRAFYATADAPAENVSTEIKQLDDPETMTVATLTDELTAAAVEIPPGSLKADLVTMVKKSRKVK